MDDSSGWNLSRRGFLAGAAGAAAAAALRSSSAAQAAVALPSSHRPAATAPVAGATISPLTYGMKDAVDAANKFDGYVGSRLARISQKCYIKEDLLSLKHPPAYMTRLANAGCQFVADVQPPKARTSSTRAQLSAWLGMLNDAGISYRVVLYSECNNSAFTTPDEWFAYWAYYAPVVKDAGISCGYNPGCGYASQRALDYFPSTPAVDELWMDFYATGFRASARLDPLIALAHSKGVAGAGMAEWGWAAGDPVLDPMTIGWWNDYCGYLMHLAKIGHVNLGGMYFGSASQSATNNVINSASDPRVPMIQKVSTALTAG